MNLKKSEEVKMNTKILKETTSINQAKINNPPQQNLKKKKKNRNAAFAMNRGQQENIDLLKLISFIEDTKKTLSNFGDQLKTQVNFNSIQ